MAEAALSRLGEQAWGDASATRDEVREASVCAFAAGAAPAAPGAGLTGRLAQLLFAVRRHQKKHFPGALGSDSCGAVLLQLYAAHVYQYQLHVQALPERTGVSGTTVLRAVDALIAAGFATRSKDRFDRRPVVVELTEAGAAAMKDCLVNSGSRAALF